ncbi:DUF5081 family protein [Bacillus licheniformis]|nr:DUF5081 family protein [Bacillus licheniformis]
MQKAEQDTLDYVEKREVYLSLISKVSFLVREPRDQDRAFLTKPMSAAEKAEVRAMNLDEKEVLAVETFKLASTKDSLIEKGILLKEGKLTKTAFFLIKLLQHYQESGEYVRFNNVMCAFLPDDEERVIALTEISPGKGRRFFAAQ